MKFVIGLVAALIFAPVAMAGDIGIVPASMYGGVVDPTGKVMNPTTSSPATVDTFDFGFEAQYVRVCIRKNGGRTVYFRPGHTIAHTSQAATADLTRMTIYTPSGNFTDPNIVQRGGALPMFTEAASNDNGCVTMNVVTRGITMFISSGQATADVWAFPKAQNFR